MAQLMEPAKYYTQCDRCGEKQQGLGPYGWLQFEVKSATSLLTVQNCRGLVVDLCPRCTQTLESWIADYAATGGKAA